MQKLRWIAAVGGALSLLGAFEALKISWDNYSNVSTCPKAWFIPACYIVTFSYSLMSVGWLRILFHKTQYFNLLFWIGFSTAFLLAVVGSSGQAIGVLHCPATASGTPKCYFSLLFLIIQSVIWLVAYRQCKK